MTFRSSKQNKNTDNFMKRFLFLAISSLVFLASCQKPYVRKELEEEVPADGTEIRYGLSNCYIAYNKTSLAFDVKAYPVNENNFTTFKKEESAWAPVADSVALVWRDKGLTISDLSIDYTKREVSIGTISGFGNAVVAIYNEGEMLWSFHIWKPRVNPDSTVLYASIKADVMVLNLGAEDLFRGLPKTSAQAYSDRTVGLLYQWGRKDPLGRPKLNSSSNTYQEARAADNTKINWDSDAVPTSKAYEDAKNKWKLLHIDDYSDPDTLEKYAMEYIHLNAGTIIRDWSIKHPTTLIYPDDANMTFNMTDAAQWTDTQKYGETYRKYWYEMKNAYDPCPEGYMLPTTNLYKGFIADATQIVSEGTSSSNYKVETVDAINADEKKSQMETYGGFNFLYYGSFDSTRTTFYPACGYRDGYSSSGKNGCLTSVGTMGRYHGYTSSTSYIRIFYFQKSELAARYGYYPSAKAVSVRCIKEMKFDEGED